MAKKMHVDGNTSDEQQQHGFTSDMCGRRDSSQQSISSGISVEQTDRSTSGQSAVRANNRSTFRLDSTHQIHDATVDYIPPDLVVDKRHQYDVRSVGARSTFDCRSFCLEYGRSAHR
jgi:hypothetical protein